MLWLSKIVKKQFYDVAGIRGYPIIECYGSYRELKMLQCVRELPVDDCYCEEAWDNTWTSSTTNSHVNYVSGSLKRGHYCKVVILMICYRLMYVPQGELEILCNCQCHLQWKFQGN